jgi:hypothetical protein
MIFPRFTCAPQRKPYSLCAPMQVSHHAFAPVSMNSVARIEQYQGYISRILRIQTRLQHPSIRGSRQRDFFTTTAKRALAALSMPRN